MNTLTFLKNRTCQFEPKDLFPSTDMSQVENEISAQHNLHRHLPHLLSERMLDIGRSDKVFASRWLKEDVFLLGTKTNQVNLQVPSFKPNPPALGDFLPLSAKLVW